MSLDLSLLALVLSAGLALVWGQVRREPLGGLAWGAVLIVGLAGAVAVSAGWKSSLRRNGGPTAEGRIENRPIAVADDGYVSSGRCRACHPRHYDTWHASHHRTMTQVPSTASVVADFDDATVHHFGRDFRFYRGGEGFFMQMETPRSRSSAEPAESRTLELVLSTGAHHQQAFWFATENARSLGKLPLTWLVEERRWVPYGSIFVAPPSRLDMRAGVWNRTCIQCHVVSGRPRWEPESGHDSRVAEFGISCEACHGPAQGHAADHRNPLNRYREHFSSEDDPTLVNPEDLSHERSSQVCGQCHSVFELRDARSRQAFDRDGFAYRPGDDLHASRHVFRYGPDEDALVVQQKLESSPRFFEQRFWPDGMVRVSGREYNGMLETPCHQRGTLSCLSCHVMHQSADDPRPREEWADDQLQPGMRGNRACVQCHTEYEAVDRLAAHTHHPARSPGSNCYNCHMPHTTLGLMKAIRSHTVDNPNVATSIAAGRPNACNLCHLDQTLDWTSQKLAAWYGIPAPELSPEEREIAASVRWILEGDAGQRAIAGWHYGWPPAREASGTEWMGAYLAELLDDSYDVVRFIGYRSLRELPGFADFDYDFVGSEVSREVGRLRALEVWSDGDRPAPSKPLLIGDQGALIQGEFDRIRSRRLDPVVILAE